jgi:hypothetical protein
LKSATICGIAVIFTRRAPTAPKTLPIRAATGISQVMCKPVLTSVATIAIAMPTAPIQLPRRAVAGDDRNRSASTKHTIVTR